MRVFCYRNLHKKGVVWSVRNTRTQRVVDHATTVHIKDCDLVVQLAGRARVIREKRKHVHAGVRGERVSRGPANAKWIDLYYNPYVRDTFIDCYGNAVKGAKYIKLTKDGCFGIGLEFYD